MDPKFCVVGGGIIGLWTAVHLQRAGHQTVLMDQFPLPHTRGSSHGGSRVWRLLGDDDPTKVVYSMKEWLKLEAQAGSRLFVQTGLLNFGPSDDSYLRLHMGVLRTHNFPCSYLSAQEIKQRYPMMDYPPEWGAVWDPSGGILLANQCLVALQNHFRELGGRIWHARVTRVASDLKGAWVHFEDLDASVSRKLLFSRVVVCAGAWAKALLPQVAPFLQAVAVPVTYFRENINTASSAITPTANTAANTKDHANTSLPEQPALELAASRIRSLKARRAPLEEVKRAIEDYLREKDAIANPAKSRAVYSAKSGFPVLFNARLTDVYCIPAFEYPDLLKVLVHTGVEVDPEVRDTADVSEAVRRVQAYTRKHLPHLQPGPAIVEKCFYTLTPDGNPIMDEVAPNIIVGAGYSGSGFKHSPASGLLLCGLALGLPSPGPGYQLERYRLARFLKPSSKL